MENKDHCLQMTSRYEWNTEEILSGKHPFKWSLMTDTDRSTLRATVESMCDSLGRETLNFCEIGTYNGATAWGVKSVVEAKGKKLNYHGIDVMTHDTVLWPGANFFLGDSTKIFYKVSCVFDILFIDGPHCVTNCMLDFLNFAPKVKVGGLILFHDASPASQCKLPFSPEKIAEYEKGGWEIPAHEEFGTAVIASLKKLGLLDKSRRDYELVSENWTQEPFGGISIYKKLG